MRFQQKTAKMVHFLKGKSPLFAPLHAKHINQKLYDSGCRSDSSRCIPRRQAGKNGVHLFRQTGSHEKKLSSVWI